ncbi:hypothetical protein HFD84_14005 [Brevibacillus laterosporus]|nr:hypothetical protein [Brevibacillus laterosporus]
MERGTMRKHTEEACPYCKGEGYFHVAVGGTENCPSCKGNGMNIELYKQLEPIRS